MLHPLLTHLISYGKLNIVQHWVERGFNVLNKVVASKEAILSACLELLEKEGMQALNIRTVAQSCGISVGSVYNYFPSKADLLSSAVQHVWHEIFRAEQTSPHPEDFCGYLNWFFERVQTGASKFPNFFSVHPISFAENDKNKGRQMMAKYFEQIKAQMLHVLIQDKNISLSVFDDTLSQKALIDFAFENLMLLLSKQDSTADTPTGCNILTEMIRRALRLS